MSQYFEANLNIHFKKKEVQGYLANANNISKNKQFLQNRTLKLNKEEKEIVFLPYLNERDHLGRLINKERINKNLLKRSHEFINDNNNNNSTEINNDNEQSVFVLPNMKFNGNHLDQSQTHYQENTISRVALVINPKRKLNLVNLQELRNPNYDFIFKRTPCYKIGEKYKNLASQSVQVESVQQMTEELQSKKKTVQNDFQSKNVAQKLKKVLKFKVKDDQYNLKINDSQFISDFETIMRNALNYSKMLRNKISQLRMTGLADADL